MWKHLSPKWPKLLPKSCKQSIDTLYYRTPFHHFQMANYRHFINNNLAPSYHTSWPKRAPKTPHPTTPSHLLPTMTQHSDSPKPLPKAATNDASKRWVKSTSERKCWSPQAKKTTHTSSASRRKSRKKGFSRNSHAREDDGMQQNPSSRARLPPSHRHPASLIASSRRRKKGRSPRSKGEIGRKISPGCSWHLERPFGWKNSNRTRSHNRGHRKSPWSIRIVTYSRNSLKPNRLKNMRSTTETSRMNRNWSRWPLNSVWLPPPTNTKT